MLGQCVRNDFKDSFIVEIMPCTAKKHERLHDGKLNIDVCITVNELI